MNLAWVGYLRELVRTRVDKAYLRDIFFGVGGGEGIMFAERLSHHISLELASCGMMLYDLSL